MLARYFVLIESDWNLKEGEESGNLGRKRVLIESDWNLKSYRLPQQLSSLRINRIRLEFKVNSAVFPNATQLTVLIESDWNLKERGRLNAS